ncbi:MAG TPA: HAMP domain-containing sensor histidine kinase [Ramlibacter sp.]|nr:HAMP domain-containing sensor histidine kinase [Ramlibacter sp.]
MTDLHHPHSDPHDRIHVLEEEVQELEAFNYAVAHELRGPLLSIRGYARQLELNDALSLPPQARMRLRRIHEVAAGMERLIDDLLALARARHLELRKQPLVLADLVREVLYELRPAYPGTRVVTSELPIVEADPALARQVLVNVIGNALKYSARAEQPLVQVGVDTRGDLYVEDNGIGFAMQQAEAVFKPFERICGSAAYSGSGVGLAIARRILERHGGWIRARSREGGPTVFTFSFGH